MKIRILKSTYPHSWYANRIGEVMDVERFEMLISKDQGIPESVFWCREGGEFNPINYVRISDANVVNASLDNEQIMQTYKGQIISNGQAIELVNKTLSKLIQEIKERDLEIATLKLRAENAEEMVRQLIREKEANIVKE